MGFQIGEGSSIHIGCKFNCRRNFEMGENSTINQYCRINNGIGVKIGNNVSISPYVKIFTADHDLMSETFLGREACVILEDHVFVGSDAMILKGVIMKTGSALGAKSLLTRSTNTYGIYQGIPAKYLKDRPHKLSYITKYKRWFY